MKPNKSLLAYSLIGMSLFGFTSAVRADQAMLRYGGDGCGPMQIVDPNLAVTPAGGSLTTAGGFVIPAPPTAVPLPAA